MPSYSKGVYTSLLALILKHCAEVTSSMFLLQNWSCFLSLFIGWDLCAFCPAVRNSTGKSHKKGNLCKLPHSVKCANTSQETMAHNNNNSRLNSPCKNYIPLDAQDLSNCVYESIFHTCNRANNRPHNSLTTCFQNIQKCHHWESY